MIDYSEFLTRISEGPLADWAEILPAQIAHGLDTKRHSDLIRWNQALTALPDVTTAYHHSLNAVEIGHRNEISADEHQALLTQLHNLSPWRKGPFKIFGITIDTEWRSDWKWNRVVPHISDLTGRRVLDVGCGSGYHAWRMYGAGATEVIGIDPSPRFVVQFYMLKKYWPKAPVDVLPVTLDSLPAPLQAFDSCFSMGVFYHRRSPMDHLRELRDALRPGGELILETLVIPESYGQLLVPSERYAQMGNVWFIPSVPTLLSWLKKIGFDNPRCVDINQTHCDEQHSTEWMKFQSLKDFLDPHDIQRTIEGYPAPRRALFIANKP
ncbi:MAG TPA: tRNA 5-methoxyuridine(34)/uridine 5-oxyacetic acid(34) synthase CmoB [Cellvibrionaceae bacterium]